MLRPVFLLSLIFFLGCFNELHAGMHRAKRGSPDFSRKIWATTVPIPYSLDSQFNEVQKTKIESALQIMADNTCLTFEENNDADVQKIEYHLITSGKCNGIVVDTYYDGPVEVELLAGCVQPTGIHHETMHALGFRHTHTRPDRDNYVVVADAYKESSNFEKIVIGENYIDYGIPYEFNSPLHYDKSPKMWPIDPDYNTVMFGNYMLFNDWKLINMHYKCNQTCETPLDCLNGGYQHAPKCNQCVCPHFFSGNRCEVETHPVNLQAGQVLPLDYEFKWDKAAFERTNRESSALPFEEFEKSPSMIIRAPEGSRIVFNIVNIAGTTTEQSSTISCNRNAIEIVEGGDLTRVGKRFCSKSRIGYSITSTSNVLGFRVYAAPGYHFVANVTFAVTE